MNRFIAFLALTLILAGCVSTRASIDSLGVKVGDKISIAGDSAIYECEPRATTADMWRQKPTTKHCLTLQSRINKNDKVVGSVPSGTVISVSKIKYSNGIDTVFYVAYVRLPDSAEDLIVYDFELPSLRGDTKAGR